MPGTALLHRAIRVEKWARSLNLLFLAVLVAATLGVLLGAKPAYAKTFTVDVTADLPDLEDNACVVSGEGGGHRCAAPPSVRGSYRSGLFHARQVQQISE
jgi:hypothetical protein